MPSRDNDLNLSIFYRRDSKKAGGVLFGR
jgi:hypothetical protein